MATKVNKQMKSLIIEDDDNDIPTDVSDEVQVNLLSGSPSKRQGEQDNPKQETKPNNDGADATTTTTTTASNGRTGHPYNN